MPAFGLVLRPFVHATVAQSTPTARRIPLSRPRQSRQSRTNGATRHNGDPRDNHDPGDNHTGHRTRSRPRTFDCLHCGAEVASDAPGTAHRNHCPACLWSRHLDADRPGDRAASCGAPMEPVAICVRGAGEWVLLHRCRTCGELSLNRTAGDDSPLLLVQLAVRPIAQAPFPLDLLHRL